MSRVPLVLLLLLPVLLAQEEPVPLSPGESDPPEEAPEDGGYTDYSEWGECSVTCGGGQQTRTRTCTSPAPARGGADCVGEASESQSCNPDLCPADVEEEPPKSPVLSIEIDDSGTATCSLLHYNTPCDFEMLISGEVVAEATDVSVSYTNENTTMITCTADCYDGLEFSADYPQEDWGPSISMQTLIIIIVVSVVVLIMVVGILVYFVCKRRNGRPKHQPLSDKQVEDYEMENEAPESKMME